MHKYSFIFILIFCLLAESAFAITSCNYGPDHLKELNNFGILNKNIGLTLTCCGNNSTDPGLYLKDHKDIYNYNSCVSRFKNGLPPSNQYSPKISPLECIGAGLSEAWKSLKSNANGLWDMIKHPIATASEMAEFGKLLLTEEGRTQVYKLIKKAIQDEANEFLTCLTPDEKEEKLCQLTGAFASNFVPPALLIKALLTTMKTGKISVLMSKMATKIVDLDKQKALKTTKNIIETPVRKSTFTLSEIKSNALLSDKDRVTQFEKIMGLSKGSFANDPKKVSAILLAHNQEGTIGTLNFSQIKARVRILKKNGFSNEEIRAGLDSGIFGNLEPDATIPYHLRSSPIESLPNLKNDGLKDVKIITEVKNTKFDSGQNLFKGDNNQGIEILQESNGDKIFAKIKYPPLTRNNFTEAQTEALRESFIVESKFAKTLSDLGIGPKFKGVYQGKDGRYRIATEYIEGYEVHLGETPAEIKKLKLSTIYEMKEKALIAVKNGIDPFDLQYRISNTGVPYIIDPEHFSHIDPANKAEILKEIENDFAELIRSKISSSKKD